MRSLSSPRSVSGTGDAAREDSDPPPCHDTREARRSDIAECTLCSRTGSPRDYGVVDPDPRDEGIWETRFTLGNGYFATRGAVPEHAADGVHYPAVYVAGIYNRLDSVVDGQTRTEESIVNLPNWLPVHLRAESDDLLDPRGGRIAHDHRLLDMESGVLLREVHSVRSAGQMTVIRQERIVSMHQPHLGYSRTTVVALNWAGPVHIDSGTRSDVRNENADISRGLATRHIVERGRSATADGECMLHVETSQSHVRISVATRTQVAQGLKAHSIGRAGSIGMRWSAAIREGVPLIIDKKVAIFTSRDLAISEPGEAAARALDHSLPYEEARRAHETAWRSSWARTRFSLRTAPSHTQEALNMQTALNLHLFHVGQTLSTHTAEIDVGVPARGLHGEGYGGRVFWDELFVFPLLNLRMPELTRSLLLYRHRRLTEARRLAQSIGECGALFPWQSASDGREATPALLYNPRTHKWIEDHSHLQFHAGLSVAYNTWHYFQVTGDINFLASHGAELLVEIARFWSSCADYDPLTGRYHLRGMMSPDEFHDGYPSRPGRGIDDSAYVAVMTAWLMRTALGLREVLGGDESEAWVRLAVEPSEIRQWRTLSRRLHVPFLNDGMLAPFEGWDDLSDIDLESYRRRYGDIGRLDLILDAEGDSTARYKVCKQADVLMLLYLFSSEELGGLLTRLGYDFDPASIPATVDYYVARTTHGSTLSRVAHAWVLARGDREGAWDVLGAALETDVAAGRSETTREGIHVGAMAATADILQRCFTGLEARSDSLFLHPRLPAPLERLQFDFRYRGHWLTLTADHVTLRLSSRAGPAAAVSVVIDGQRHTLESGASLIVPLTIPGRSSVPSVSGQRDRVESEPTGQRRAPTSPSRF